MTRISRIDTKREKQIDCLREAPRTKGAEDKRKSTKGKKMDDLGFTNDKLQT